MTEEIVMDGYVRVSRVLGREGDSYISPDVQRDAIARWAEYKNVTIGDWFIDEDWSGGTHARPGLEAAVARALDGTTSGIVSWKIDRFSRHTEGGLTDLRRLREQDARLAFVVEDIDTSSVYGRMIYTILLAVSEAFLENVKAGWVIAKARATERGAKIGPTPFGYTRAEDGTLLVDPDEGPIVTEAYRRAALSVQSAAAYLRDAAPERVWTTSSVRRLLAARSYLGETIYGEQVATGTHEPLTTLAAWSAAQSTPSARASHSDFVLSGVIRCGSCGTHMVGARGGRRGQRMYRCAAGLTTYRGAQCPAPATITADRVEAYVRGVVREALAGLRGSLSDPDTEEATRIAAWVADAEAELEAFASDMTMRRALGDRFHAHLQARVENRDAAHEAQREHASRDAAAQLIDGPQVADDDELLPIALGSLWDRVLVQRGRGLAVEDRVVLVPHEADEPAGVAST